MLYFFYNCLLLILLIIYMPVLLYKMAHGKYRQGFKQRFGFLEQDIINKFSNKPTIWIHAVSVGETVAAGPIVKALKKEKPEYRILFSTVTDTGHKMAEKIISEADELIYFPLDFSPAVNRVLNKINPELVILTETELWPNFIRLAAQKNIKTMLVNGRISDDSAKKYKYLGPFMKDMLNNIDILSMQSRQDEQYVLNLGAQATKVYNTGNTKFDQDYGTVDEEEREELHRKLKIKETQPVFVAGSTHANEEEQLLYVYKKLKEKYRELLFIIAPRHIERANRIAAYYNKAGVKTINYTSISGHNYNDNRVIILDVIGKLTRIYAVADLVFIGGSLVEIGGHNMLEAAAHGKMSFFGPHMFNFKDSTELTLQYKAGVQVSDAAHLLDEIEYFLENKEELRLYGKKALEMIKANKGATKRNTELALCVLEGKHCNICSLQTD